MNKPLDLNNVRIYSNTKYDILDAMDLIGQDVYVSNFSDFHTYDICNLAGVAGIKYIESDSCHFLVDRDKGDLGFHKYRFLILAKDAKFKEEKEIKMNKETILKEYEETIQKRDELLRLLSYFDSNTEFSHSSFALLWLLRENFIQNVKILETIAENEKIYEFYEIQRKQFIPVTSTSEEKPKKLRPFKSTREFEQVTGCSIGDVITICKVDGGFEETCIVNGYRYSDLESSKPTIVYMALGADKYSLEELFRYFKYRKNDELLPFGVKDE